MNKERKEKRDIEKGRISKSKSRNRKQKQRTMYKAAGLEVNKGNNNSRQVLRIGVVLLGVLGAFFVFSNYSVPKSNYVMPQDQVFATNNSITNGFEVSSSVCNSSVFFGNYFLCFHVCFCGVFLLCYIFCFH